MIWGNKETYVYLIASVMPRRGVCEMRTPDHRSHLHLLFNTP